MYYGKDSKDAIHREKKAQRAKEAAAKDAEEAAKQMQEAEEDKSAGAHWATGVRQTRKPIRIYRWDRKAVKTGGTAALISKMPP